MTNAERSAKIVYPLYLEVEPKIAEDLQRRIEEALDHQDEIHAREIGNMAKDAFQEAALALLGKVRSFGYCSFCNEVLVTNTLDEAKAKQREHSLECPELRKALATVVPTWLRESLITAWDNFNAALPDGEYAGLGVMRMAIAELKSLVKP